MNSISPRFVTGRRYHSTPVRGATDHQRLSFVFRLIALFH
jgi:hypothetical protein